MKVQGPFDSLRGIAAPLPIAISGPSSKQAHRPKISLVLDKYLEIFVGLWRESQSIFSMSPYHTTHRYLSIDRSEGPPLNKFLKVRLLYSSTEEVYFVPLGGHIDQNLER
ncbi:hypothetical protein KY290_001114 [Solanum tuberosum]|uniref:Uncharacterized protein n=1 Tax=Solanum tuberosum TaxID=4113 RepID=A0ABQ7WMK3_SOLTU|nr:hypothetical protein KY290_001114 [Solanum tuberosum]